MIASKKFTGVYSNLLKNKDKSYYVTYKREGKKEWFKVGLHSEGIREAYCKKIRDKIILKLRLGEEVPTFLKKEKSFTLNTIALDFFKQKYYKSSTYRTLWGRYKNHIYPTLGELEIDKIDKDKCEELYNDKKNNKNLSDKSVQLILELLKSIINYAISNKKFKDINPVKTIKIKKVDNARERFLTKEEVELLLHNIEENKNAYLFTLLSLSTGGRLHDVYSIQKKQFNLKNRTVSIKNSKGNSTYQAFLTKRVLPFLALDKLQPNDILYDVSERSIQRYMKKKLDELFNIGLDVKDSKNRVVVHSLRHTFASHLAINGTPIYTIMKLCDHKNIEDTMRYAKLSPENGREFVEALF